MLHRPYIRNSTRQEVENRAEKNEKGQFLDANTGKAIENNYHLGHKYGHEFRYEKAQAEKEGLTQKEFNDRMNNPDLYQIEDPKSNMSHKYESPVNPYEAQNNTNASEAQNNSGVSGFMSTSMTNSETTASENTSSMSESEANSSTTGGEQSGNAEDTSGETSTEGSANSEGEEGGEDEGQTM